MLHCSQAIRNGVCRLDLTISLVGMLMAHGLDVHDKVEVKIIPVPVSSLLCTSLHLTCLCQCLPLFPQVNSQVSQAHPAPSRHLLISFGTGSECHCLLHHLNSSWNGAPSGVNVAQLSKNSSEPGHACSCGALHCLVILLVSETQCI